MCWSVNGAPSPCAGATCGLLYSSAFLCVESKMSFHPTCHNNVVIINNGTTARRLSEALSDRLETTVYSNKPLDITSGDVFQVRFDRVNDNWYLGEGPVRILSKIKSKT